LLKQRKTRRSHVSQNCIRSQIQNLQQIEAVVVGPDESNRLLIIMLSFYREAQRWTMCCKAAARNFIKNMNSFVCAKERNKMQEPNTVYELYTKMKAHHESFQELYKEVLSQSTCTMRHSRCPLLADIGIATMVLRGGAREI